MVLSKGISKKTASIYTPWPASISPLPRKCGSVVFLVANLIRQVSKVVDCAQKFRCESRRKTGVGRMGPAKTGSSTCEHPAPDVGDKMKQGETPFLRDQGAQTGMEVRVG